jgi:glycolate oxidase iron-sulfur subunit
MCSCADSHLCCGSAGTYSVLQPELSYRLRDNKISKLQATDPDMIVTGNIGCVTHLQSGTETPVRHGSSCWTPRCKRLPDDALTIC